MDGRKRLTFEEFMKMPRKEQNVRYRDLSDHDKFRARLADVTISGPEVLCNYCAHYYGFDKCDAYPEGIPKEVDEQLVKNPEYPCSDKYKFENLGHLWCEKKTVKDQ